MIPGTKYYYRIDNAAQLPGGTVDGTPFYGSFKVPGGFPLRLAVGADSGEVTNVTQNIAFVEASKPDAMLLTGEWVGGHATGREEGEAMGRACCFIFHQSSSPPPSHDQAI